MKGSKELLLGKLRLSMRGEAKRRPSCSAVLLTGSNSSRAKYQPFNVCRALLSLSSCLPVCLIFSLFLFFFFLFPSLVDISSYLLHLMLCHPDRFLPLDPSSTVGVCSQSSTILTL